MSRPSRCLIVGCGIAGPALALALALQGIRSTIVETRARTTEQGGSITLAPNALRVLDKLLGVYDRLREVGFSYNRLEAVDDTGYRYGAILNGEEHEGGYPCIRIMRADLRDVLLDACARHADLVEVRWETKIASIRDEDDGVALVLADGSTIKGDLLFGADGVHSRVRQHILPDAPSPRYTGAAIVNTIVDRKSVGLPPGGLDFPAFVFAPTGFVGIFGLSGSRLAWGVTESVAKPPSLDRDGWAEYYSSGAAIEAIREHYGAITTEPVRSLVASMDGAKMQLWTPYELDELPRWSRGRTLLLGNAAHAMPPNGQGSAMALEDVAFLARLFDSDDVRAGGHEALFARFEAVRRRRVAYVRKMGKSASPIKSSTAPDSWKWWAKKWGIYLFFALKSRFTFVVTLRGLTKYDVMAEPL